MATIKKIEINGKKYDIVPMDANTVCDLDEIGISLADYATKPIAFMRAYLSLVMGIDKRDAGIVLGESPKAIIDQLSAVVKQEIENSGFFRKLNESQKESNPTGEN